jgi:outer membrane protein OmpA-like peptidoglycan-associated protein
MRRVENKSLDRALSQFEAANSRPFIRYIPSSSSSGSNIQPTSAKPSPTKQKRVLLPPLPLQARSRPVRSSAQKTTPSSSSGSTSIANIPQNDEEEEKEPVDDDEDDNDKTPKASDIRKQDTTAFDSDGAEIRMSQESDSIMDKLVKWTQSSTDSSRAIEA